MDGGRAALLGFLYQILGSAGFLAADVDIDPRGDSGDLDARLRVTKDATLRQEVHGQDALIELPSADDSDYLLIQFKFSASEPPRKIGKKELETIIATFEKSLKSLEAEAGAGKIVTCILVTNRDLGPTATKALDGAAKTASGLLGKMAYKRFTRQEAIRNVDALRCRLGLSKEEFDAGMVRIVGEMMNGIEAGVPLSRHWVIQKLGNCADPRLITREGLRDVMREEHDRFCRDRRVPVQAIRRALQLEIDSAVGAAIVLLRGGGGLGKTVLLSQVTGAALQPTVPTAYVAVETAQRLSENWLSWRVQRWRNVLHRRESTDRAYERLVTAAGDAEPPLVVLGVDAVDEFGTAGREARPALHDLLDFIESRILTLEPQNGVPRVRLILTYRTPEELTRIWPLDTREHYIRTGQIVELDLAELDDAEVLNMCGDADRGVRSRIESHLATTGRPPRDQAEPWVGGSAASTDVISNQGGTFAPIADESLSALRHPTLLRLFLGELSAQHQMEFLDGDEPASNALWEAFVSRMVMKLELRRDWIAREDVLNTLRSIALNNGVNGPGPYAKQEWVTAALADGHLGGREANRLYEEVASFGLLVVDPQDLRWQWIHAGLTRYLSVQDQEQGGAA